MMAQQSVGIGTLIIRHSPLDYRDYALNKLKFVAKYTILLISFHLWILIAQFYIVRQNLENNLIFLKKKWYI